jgi:hypothetical protein
MFAKYASPSGLWGTIQPIRRHTPTAVPMPPSGRLTRAICALLILTRCVNRYFAKLAYIMRLAKARLIS